VTIAAYFFPPPSNSLPPGEGEIERWNCLPPGEGGRKQSSLRPGERGLPLSFFLSLDGRGIG